MLRASIAAAVVGALGLCAGCNRHAAATSASVSGDRRVDQLLAQMSLEEKISLLHGSPEDPATDQGQAGYLRGLARLGIPALRLADGPPGVLTRYPATGLTATMGLAATFSPEDARRNGAVIARDARALGIDVVLEPYINIHRDQTFSRAYNTYGEDPLLSARIGAALITGIQDLGVMAQAKHYIAYDGADNVSIDAQTLHEIYLPPFEAAVNAGVSSIMCAYNRINAVYACGNADTLTRILRNELGFSGFVTSDWGAVHGADFINAGLDLEMPGSGTVMDSYFEATVPRPDARRVMLVGPRSNPIPEEAAVAVSSPAAAPAVVEGPPASAPTGMLSAIQSGAVKEQAVTRAAGRILHQLNRFGLLDRKPAHATTPPALAANAEAVRKTAQDAAVLLKNEAHALPLAADDLASLAMVGPGARQTIATGDSGEKALGHIERQIGALTAIKEEAGASNPHIAYAVADDMDGTPIPAANFSHQGRSGLLRAAERGAAPGIDPDLNLTTANARALPAGSGANWSGTLHIAHAGVYRLYLQMLGAAGSLRIDGRLAAETTSLQLHGNVLQPSQDNVLPTSDGLDNVRREIPLAAGDHAVSVQLRPDASGQPMQVRLSWVTPEQKQADYLAAIAAAKHARKAVVFAWSRGRPAFHLPGDQDRLIADVAAVNRNTVVVLNISEPIAMPWLDKVRAVLLMWYPGDEGGYASADVLLGRANPAGRLPFTWPKALEQNLANDPQHLERSSAGIAGRTHYSEGIFVGYRWFDQGRLEPLYPFGYGLSYSSFDYSGLSVRRAPDGGLDVAFELHNASARAGDEVPQVYLGAPSARPAGAQFAVRALAAFDRVHLDAGETRPVRLHVAPRALQYWSTAEGKWITAGAERIVYVAASSRDLRLQATIQPVP